MFEPQSVVRLDLRENWRQFWLLVLVNAFVGAMVGLERTVLPLLAEEEFGLAARGVILSFIATFGLVKAATDFFAGRLADRFGRKRILLAGWHFGLPVPFLLIWASTWSWVLFGIGPAIVAGGMLALCSGLVVFRTMPETRPPRG